MDTGVLAVGNGLFVPLREIEFTFTRSSGPGGQNVNKVNSKAVLRWQPRQNQSLPSAVLERFLERYGGRLTREGSLILAHDASRDRERNRQGCLAKLAEMIRLVAVPPKKRRATKPTKSSVQRRISGKKKRGEIKRGRRTSRDDY